jgi:large subunit ribosomal protein L23
MTPVVTEKSLSAQAQGKYSFWVDRSATKNQIAAAFKNIFDIDPLSVNTTLIKGKSKTNWKTRKTTQKPDRKKAIITVAKDAKLEILKLAK